MPTIHAVLSFSTSHGGLSEFQQFRQPPENHYDFFWKLVQSSGYLFTNGIRNARHLSCGSTKTIRARNAIGAAGLCT